MTTSLAPEQTLTETLARLETALLSPPIAGELGGWVRSVQEAAATLAVNLTTYQRTVLQEQYAEIMQADPELAAHVEKLTLADQQLLQEVADFHERLYHMAEAAAHVSRDEGKLAEQRKRLEEQGIALIVSIKKQQAAAATWLNEAYFRDRGVKD